MSLFTLFAFCGGILVGYALTTILVLSDDGDHDCTLAYKAGYEEGRKDGLREAELGEL
jgi:hypothetical protein